MSVSRISRGVTSMENHGIEIAARSVKPPAAPRDPRGLQGADDALDDEQHEEDDHEGQVEHPHRRDDAPERPQHRLGEIGEETRDRRHRAAGTHGEPGEDGARREHDQVDAKNPADELHRGQARYRPRACNRSLSSSETSTLVGVKRNTWSSTFRIVPPTAYASPLEKSIRRRWRSRSRPRRLRTTASLAFKWSRSSCASLNPLASTTCTGDDVCCRTTAGLGVTSDDASSRGTGRTKFDSLRGMGGGSTASCNWSSCNGRTSDRSRGTRAGARSRAGAAPSSSSQSDPSYSASKPNPAWSWGR